MKSVSYQRCEPELVVEPSLLAIEHVFFTLLRFADSGPRLKF
jgi:hypothetical protein